MSEYDDLPRRTASALCESAYADLRASMADILRTSATALVDAEESGATATELDWLGERLLECALLAGTLASVLRGGGGDGD